MPGWREIGEEINETAKTEGDKAYDITRRKYLRMVSQETGRHTILYATNWTAPGFPEPGLLMISDEDMQGMMEMLCTLKVNDKLDLILHSPGGSAEATEAVVKYLRSKFSDIRVIIPHAAMSAATMLACSANRIVMGNHSFIGPIDPQIVLDTPLGRKMVPAQAILDQFSLAQNECADSKKLASWLPMLQLYGPALLVECKEALALSKILVSRWLSQYMFAGEIDAIEKASKAADRLADHKEHMSHGRHIDKNEARNIGLVVDDLETNQKTQDLILSVFHATMHTFNKKPTIKIVESDSGRAFIKTFQVIALPGPTAPPPQKPSQQPPKDR